MANDKDKTKKSEEEAGGKGAANEEETIKVPKSQLTEILKKIEDLQASNERLAYAADRGRLDQFDNANKPKELTRVRLNVYEDPGSGEPKVIMAWKMIMDEVVYDRVRGYIEKQIIELTFDDGTKTEVAYGDFAIGKRRKQQQAEIIGRRKNEKDGTEIFTVKRIEDQKEFEIDSRFIN